MRRLPIALVALGAALTTTPALAAPTVTVTVKAFDHSTSGGSPLVTGVIFAAGKRFQISSSTNDLWSSGEIPRYSDGDGIVPRTANGIDDSGRPFGTQIGTTYPLYTQGNLTARYGSLVADLGGNTFQLLGANGVFTSAGGPLNLAYFDSNNGDNSGEIAFSITAVPEPAAWAFMIVGFGAVGATMRRRRVAGRGTAFA